MKQVIGRVIRSIICASLVSWPKKTNCIYMRILPNWHIWWKQIWRDWKMTHQNKSCFLPWHKKDKYQQINFIKNGLYVSVFYHKVNLNSDNKLFLHVKFLSPARWLLQDCYDMQEHFISEFKLTLWSCTSTRQMNLFKNIVSVLLNKTAFWTFYTKFILWSCTLWCMTAITAQLIYIWSQPCNWWH